MKFMNYQVIDSSSLPRDVFDDVVDECCQNDTAHIVNPDYAPRFKKYLEENGFEVKCYMVWVSW